MIRLLAAPAKVGGRSAMKFLNVGMGLLTGTLGKIFGAQLLTDVQTFVSAMDSMFGGFRERADRTYQLLKAPGTAFLVVAAPERDALREAAYFVDRLEADRMPMAGLVLNRVHSTGAPQLTAERALAAAEALEENGSETASPKPNCWRPDSCACTPSGCRSWPASGAPGTVSCRCTRTCRSSRSRPSRGRPRPGRAARRRRAARRQHRGVTRRPAADRRRAQPACA